MIPIYVVVPRHDPRIEVRDARVKLGTDLKWTATAIVTAVDARKRWKSRDVYVKGLKLSAVIDALGDAIRDEVRWLRYGK